MMARAAAAYVVSVRDDVDARIAGHGGGGYTSPPQPRADALALIGLLVGSGAAAEGSGRWTCPVPGGRRTITLTASRGDGGVACSARDGALAREAGDPPPVPRR